MGIDVGKIGMNLIKWGPMIAQLVQGAKDKYGNSKTGREKFTIVKDAVLSSVPIGEGMLGKDYINEANLAGGAAAIEALIDESIEVAYTIMKAKERLAVIGQQLANLKGTGAPL